IWANLLLFGDVAGLIGFPRWAATLLATIIALLAIELAHTADAPEKSASSREGAERRTGRRVYRMALRGGGLTLLYTSALGSVAPAIGSCSPPALVSGSRPASGSRDRRRPASRGPTRPSEAVSLRCWGRSAPR